MYVLIDGNSFWLRWAVKQELGTVYCRMNGGRRIGLYRPVAEQKVLTHATMDLPLLKAVRGEWTDADGTVVALALDVKGRADFYRLYHGVPPFAKCQDCPHGGNLDTV